MLGGTAAASSRTKLRMSTERSLDILYLSFCRLSCRGVFTVLSVSIFYFFSRQSFQRSASPFRPLLLWTGCIVAGFSSLRSCISLHNLEASSLAVLIPVTPLSCLDEFFCLPPQGVGFSYAGCCALQMLVLLSFSVASTHTKSSRIF